MKDVELIVSALNASTMSAGNFVVVLQEIGGSRRLSIIIGLQEAQTIAVALEQMHPIRPLTHDLFLTMVGSLKADLEYVRICDLKDGIYISEIVIKDRDNNILKIDSRTSDAIALAVRQKCSIFINDSILVEMTAEQMEAGRILSEKTRALDQYSLQELRELLSDLLQKEDYERAGLVRDVIAKKEQR